MALYVLTYLCVAVFVIAAAVRVFKYMAMPTHLRWELYPVKHEAGKKADYGGSYLEESDWWEKERESSLVNELKYMVPEILFVHGLYKQNRKMWFVSFPFHFGLYLLLGTFGLLVISAVWMILNGQVAPGAGIVGATLYYLTLVAGIGGLVLGAFGSLGLLLRRLTDSELRPYNTFSDYFNLILFVAFFGSAIAAWLISDNVFDGARAYMYGLFTFGGVAAGYTGGSAIGAVAAVIISVVAAYVPLTHMSHMFMKYFMYHDIRWGDEPNMKGSKLEANLLSNLGMKPTWAASHIQGDGKKTWVDLAVSNPEEDK